MTKSKILEMKKQTGTSDMPSPQTMDYTKTYKVTDLFKNDLNTVLSDIAYADASKYIKYIDAYNSIFTAAVLHEFLQMLKQLPYKTVLPLMRALENKDNFSKYFKQVDLGLK